MSIIKDKTIASLDIQDVSGQQEYLDDNLVLAKAEFLDMTNTGDLINGESVIATLSVKAVDGQPITINIIKIFRNERSILYISDVGDVYACGSNVNGELLPDSKIKYVNKITKLSVSNVKDVACGKYHTMFLFNDGTVKGCGRNYEGQLGTGDFKDYSSLIDSKLSNVKSVHCGQHNTIFILNDGTVYGTGFNEYGQLGLGHTCNVNTITKLPIEDVATVSLSRNNIIYVMNDGSMKAAGSNRYGELGIGEDNLEKVNTIVDLNF